MTTIDEWFRRKTSAQPPTMPNARRVTFAHKVQTGPYVEFASVTIRFEAAAMFSFETMPTVTWPETGRDAEYASHVVDGLLDELLAGDVVPRSTRIRAVLEDLEWVPVDSMPRAFYHAARGAVRQAFGITDHGHSSLRQPSAG